MCYYSFKRHVMSTQSYVGYKYNITTIGARLKRNAPVYPSQLCVVFIFFCANYSNRFIATIYRVAYSTYGYFRSTFTNIFYYVVIEYNYLLQSTQSQYIKIITLSRLALV